jgi:class 3 adenylate cyclase/tetratricopeptide (TPR) repeat protein
MATCPTCGNDVTQPGDVCPRCGASLGAADSSGEFRILTAVFCDVVDSTALGRRLEPLVTKRTLDRYGETVRRVLGGSGAKVGKRHGDGFMAAFGVPELHEDDALRAVRAAAELRAAIQELSEELRRDRGVDFQIRLGINTGNVLVNIAATMEEELTGDAVNLAKRFEEAAGPGGILLGEETYRLVADAVRAEPAEALVVHGFPEPQDTWHLVAVLPERPGRVRRGNAPLVGRDLERDLLLALFDRVVAERSCHLASVLGPGGVGKSRLVDEFVDGLGARATMLRAQCPQLGSSVTVWPMVEIVRQAADISSADSPELARTRVAKLVRDQERSELVAERVAQMLGIGADAAASRPEDTLWAVHRLLHARARRRPLVVIIDDLQWADAILLDGIEELVDLSQDTPILLVCIARPDELLAHRQRWPGGKVNTLSLRLSPLGEREGEQLVGHLLGGKVDPEVHALITERAQGYPLIVEELVANLRDEDLLHAVDGRWTLRLDVADVDSRGRKAIPTSIHALLQVRLERLEAGGRAIIEAASVVGEQFHIGDLEALSQAGTPAEVPTALEQLIRLDLVRPDHSPATVPLPPASGAGYRFRHPMIQSVAYERMPQDRRAHLHERYARWLAEQTRDNPDQFDELVGHHFYEAFRYRSKLDPGGDGTREVATRAGERFAAAGNRAMVRGDGRLAQAWLGRAVRLLPDDHPDRLRALPPLAEAQQASGKLTEAARAYQELAKSATAVGDEDLATHATVGRLRLMALHDPERFLRDGHKQLELAAIPVFERLGDKQGLAKAWQLLAYLEWTRGRLSVAAAAAEKARAFARDADDPYWEATVLGLHGLILFWGPTPLDEVKRRDQEVLAQARSTGMRALEANALTVLARIAALQGDVGQARELVQSATAITEDLGESLTKATDCISQALIEMLDGELADAEDMLRAGDLELERMNAAGPRAAVAALLARVLLLQDRSEEAEELTRACERIAPPDQLDAQVKWRSIRALVLARRGEAEDAERLAREAVSQVDETDQLDSRAEARVDLAEVLRLGGRGGEAARELDRAIILYREKGNAVGETNARRLLARVRQ